MKKLLMFIMMGVLSATITHAETNASKEALKKAMEKEKKYAREGVFYKADEYDFKGSQVDPKSLDKIQAIEPDYDFDMDTGVYDD